MTPTDLARYRVIFGVFALLTMPTFTWIAGYPATLWNPPPGPMALLQGPPPHLLLVALELALAVAAAALLLGRCIVTASISFTVVSIAGFGYVFSIGGVDHSILLVITPLFLAAAGWGSPRSSPWVMRLFAFTIGLAMSTAALAKLFSGGWTDPSTHATQRFMTTFVSAERTGPLGIWLLDITPGWAWETQDYLTLILEGGLVLTVFSMRLFRTWLAVLCVFHLAIALSLGILFALNVIAYAAFVPWGRLPRFFRPSLPWWGPILVGLAAWALAQATDAPRSVTDWAVIVAGVLVIVPGLLIPLMEDRQQPAEEDSNGKGFGERMPTGTDR